MRKPFFTLLLCLLAFGRALNAQPAGGLVSGPMLGPVELRDAVIWCEVSPEVNNVSIRFWKKSAPLNSRTVEYKGELGRDFNPVKFVLGGLDMNTTYVYQISATRQRGLFRTNTPNPAGKESGEFTTKDLWQWRKPAPDFSFLAGSCTYFNEPEFDRPGRPYGGDSSIFESMARTPGSFMLWLGDNWYTREVDYYSEWGLWYRASHDRAQPVLRNFLKAMPHLAIWDDHDFGPNDMGKAYTLKENSRQVFKAYWCNPSFGEEDRGVYSQYSHGDADFFLLDDRYFRSSDELPDSVNGKPNPDKRMYGPAQMEWLKNALAVSKATFKFIVTGSQALNPVSPFDKIKDFPVEYQELMDFLDSHKIKGVVFLTGDRHHSEVIRLPRTNNYPLYDITVSPLTSGTHKFGKEEANNPYRVFGLAEKQNYARISITGPRNNRKLTCEFLGVQGEKLGEWSVGEKELGN